MHVSIHSHLHWGAWAHRPFRFTGSHQPVALNIPSGVTTEKKMKKQNHTHTHTHTHTKGVPAVAQQVTNPLASMRTWVQSLAPLIGLGVKDPALP